VYHPCANETSMQTVLQQNWKAKLALLHETKRFHNAPGTVNVCTYIDIITSIRQQLAQHLAQRRDI
jgi:hypothetical protein